MSMDRTHDKPARHTRRQYARKKQSRSQKDAIWSYIGDWQTLQDGTIYRQLLEELREQGIWLQLRHELPLEDPLVRYKNVPLHALFLYTATDPLIERSILKHCATLEGISRDRCDIYLSIEQFNNPAETFDYLEYSPVLKQSNVQIGYDDLPGMFFWNREWEGEYISFRSHLNASGIDTILLRVFQAIREEPTIDAVRRVKQRLVSA